MQEDRFSRKAENIIVIVVGVLFVLLMLLIFGYDGIKRWLKMPITWNDPDFIAVEYLEREDKYGENMRFAVKNRSSNDYDEVEFFVKVNGYWFEINYELNDLRPYSEEEVSAYYSSYAYPELDEYLINTPPESVEMEWHAHYLKGRTDSDKDVNNRGTVKVLSLLAMSLVAYIIKNRIQNQWLRMFVKLLMTPGVVFIILLSLVLLIIGCLGSASGAEGSGGGDSQKADRLKNQYDNLAQRKASAEARGNTSEANFLQHQMDNTLADMVGMRDAAAAGEIRAGAINKYNAASSGNTSNAAFAQARIDAAVAKGLGGSSSAASTVSAQAANRASAIVRGNTRAAAYAQSRVDTAMAEIMAPGSSVAAHAASKASAAASGNVAAAAYAQARMDTAMADTLANKNPKAAATVRAQSALHAGDVASGNEKTAAYAQGKVDSAKTQLIFDNIIYDDFDVE